MKRLGRAAVLLQLGKELEAKGSWCGRTHYQKATYFLQEGLGVRLGFAFFLYKYGPYSFELKDEIDELENDGLFSINLTCPYGSTITCSESGEELGQRFPKTLSRYSKQISFVAEVLATKSVSELEKLATLLYVKLKYPKCKSNTARAARLHKIKPHVPIDEAVKSVQEFDSVLEGFRGPR